MSTMFEKKLEKKYRKFNSKCWKDPADALAETIEGGLKAANKKEEKERRMRRKHLENMSFTSSSDSSYSVEPKSDTAKSGAGGRDKSKSPKQMYSSDDISYKSPSPGQAKPKRRKSTRTSLSDDSDSDSDSDDGDSSSDSDDDDDGVPAVMADDEGDVISRVSSTASQWKKKTSLFSKRMKDHRRRILAKFISTHILLAIFVIGALSLYWGAIYNYSGNLYRVHSIAVIQDEPYTAPDGTVIPALTRNVTNIINSIPGNWRIMNSTEFKVIYNVTNAQEIDEKVAELIFDEKFWLAVNVREGATEAFYKSVTEEGAPVFNSTNYFQSIYESGRDPTNLKSSIYPILAKFESVFRSQYLKIYVPEFIKNITSPDFNETVNTANLYGLGNFATNSYDLRPFTDRVLLGPLSMGLNYNIMFSVFSISIFGPVNKEMAKYLKPRSLFFYRILISWSMFFFLSLFTCTVSAIFQIDFTPGFGKAGFVIYWMTSWLVMTAVGMANENILSIILTFCPQYMSYWMIIWTILNIAPSLYPLVLISRFYRFGYAMPIHNGVQIYRVIFLDISRHQMSRNYGILAAWVAVNTAINPFVNKFISKVVKKREERKELKRKIQEEREQERRRYEHRQRHASSKHHEHDS